MASMSMPNDKPRALVVIEENIPQEMKDRPKQWVLWRYIYKPKVKKWTKPPFQPDKSNADSTNSDTWYSYATVIAAYHASDGFFDGIGFVFNGDYTGIDIDHTTDAQALINDTASYAELSPSGTGVHIITRGPVTTDGKGKRDQRARY
jgi:putative DNA primase/helicase